MKLRKKDYNFDENIDIIKNKVNCKLTVPNNINYNNKINKLNNSWFSIDEYNLNNKNKVILDLDLKKEDKLEINEFKTKSIQIFPNDNQKRILNYWIESYRLMLNETIKYFKKQIYDKKILNPNFIDVRNTLKNNKKLIEKNSIIDKKKIYTHTLDYAIKDVCTNIKSMLSNLKAKNIKRFRIRYLKKSKNNKYIKFEKTSCKIIKNLDENNKLKNISFSINKLGEIEHNENELNINSDYTIIKKYNRYYIQIPVKTTQTKLENNKIIGFDLGVRTFISGYNTDRVVDICTNAKEKISIIHNKIDKLNSDLEKKLIDKRKKEKVAGKKWSKLKNVVNELHWKSIKYITDNYEKVVMGNISTSSLLKNKNTDETLKRYISALSFYKFKERLKYKCSIKGIKLKLIEENYTSKLCSSCGNLNTGVNTSKEYNCNKCKIKLDRDYNGAKNILIIGSKKIK